MVLRVSFANITPRQLAERIQGAGLSGTTFYSLGAGDWGIERGATAEFAFRSSAVPLHLAFVRETLIARGEQAAYGTVADSMGTRASLYWADGRVERID